MIYEFTNKEQTAIIHNPTGMQFSILLNPTKNDYDKENDTYQSFVFKGNNIVCLMLNPDEFEPEPEPIGFKRIEAINRKAFKFYRSKVYIE